MWKLCFGNKFHFRCFVKFCAKVCFLELVSMDTIQQGSQTLKIS